MKRFRTILSKKRHPHKQIRNWKDDMEEVYERKFQIFTLLWLFPGKDNKASTT